MIHPLIDAQVGVASIPMVDAGQMMSKSKRGVKIMRSGGVEFVAPIRMNGIDVGMINGTCTFVDSVSWPTLLSHWHFG